MTHMCNPSTLGGWGEWITRSRDQDHPGQQGETPSLLKIQKISWAWWRAPVIPATREAEAGELLEPRRRRLWWAEITPLHSSLGNKSETPSRKKKRRWIWILTVSLYMQCVGTGRDGPTGQQRPGCIVHTVWMAMAKQFSLGADWLVLNC